jgi:hypothetical protein
VACFLTALIALYTTAGCDQEKPSVVPLQPAAPTAVAKITAHGNNIIDEDEAAALVPVSTPTQLNPVTIAAAVIPQQSKPGDVVTLVVRLRIAPSFHIEQMQSNEEQSGPAMPTRIELDLPPGVMPDSDWSFPKPLTFVRTVSGSNSGYSGDVTFQRRLRIDSKQQLGTVNVRYSVNCQACNDLRCIRLEPENLIAKLKIVAPR